MKTLLPFLLLLLTGTMGSVSAQVELFKATVYQPAGSVILPSASQNKIEPADTLNQPLYTADDVLLYLPAPANIAESTTEKGERVEVIILGPRLSKNHELEVLPIGLMDFEVNKNNVSYVLAIPANPAIQTIKSPTLEQLRLNYPGVIEILSTWFENAYSDRQSRFIGVKNEEAARQLFQLK